MEGGVGTWSHCGNRESHKPHKHDVTLNEGTYKDVSCHGTPTPKARLARIAEAHSKHIGQGGMTSGLCNECYHTHPCPTYVWATEERDPNFNTWDPSDEEK